MQEPIVFLLPVQCRRKESSRSLSHLLMSFLSGLMSCKATKPGFTQKSCLSQLRHVFAFVSLCVLGARVILFLCVYLSVPASIQLPGRSLLQNEAVTCRLRRKTPLLTQLIYRRTFNMDRFFRNYFCMRTNASGQFCSVYATRDVPQCWVESLS